MPGSAETSGSDAVVNGKSGFAKELNAYTISDSGNNQRGLYRNRVTQCVIWVPRTLITKRVLVTG